MTGNNNEQWQMTLPGEWTVRQTGEDGKEIEIPLRDHPALKKYATKDEAVKALVHAQRMLGKTPEGYVRLPGDQDGPDELAAFYAALGRPEAPDGYELPGMDLPDGFELREDLLGGLREKAYELGLTPAQVSGLYQWFLPLVLDAHHGLEAEAGKVRESELESLRSVHRGDTPALLDSALRAAEAVGGKELLAALDATGAGNRAAVISAFAKIAPLVLESGLRGSAKGWGEDLSIERLREMMRDPRYSDPSKRDPAFVKKVNQGFEHLYPGDYVPGSRI
ncbi:hypothetical protein [Pseudodesulfovibrio indicus]|uniref:Uncharacterized protein n=1 Tax=Pseudodesulfovibrio indicus TaxID=1716143 RepID=A0A126QJ07_9BACT|nr:hypothetical protein [Pseudodesulfovibrio indicus]AMK09963.1 hypothetical protein AWY79_01955 [Pseudodesulfovibrio indicus]TDT87353.1 hypothetical protein EDC59_10818 [Pseudodesulfovibrio indicus]